MAMARLTDTQLGMLCQVWKGKINRGSGCSTGRSGWNGKIVVKLFSLSYMPHVRAYIGASPFPSQAFCIFLHIPLSSMYLLIPLFVYYFIHQCPHLLVPIPCLIIPMCTSHVQIFPRHVIEFISLGHSGGPAVSGSYHASTGVAPLHPTTAGGGDDEGSSPLYPGGGNAIGLPSSQCGQQTESHHEAQALNKGPDDSSAETGGVPDISHLARQGGRGVRVRCVLAESRTSVTWQGKARRGVRFRCGSAHRGVSITLAMFGNLLS